MRKLILAFAFLAVASISASAASVTLTPTETSTFLLISSTGAAPQSYNQLGDGSYSVQWNTAFSGAVSATSGITIPVRGGAGDTFTLLVVNNNGNPWNFQVSINNGFASPQASGTFSIPNNGGSHAFTFVLDANGLRQVSVTVGATIPIAGTDRGAEYQLTSVPEPTSMFLLGSGLVGLAGVARRRFRSTK